MKRFLSIITLLVVAVATATAQEVVSENTLTPRARIAPYNTAALAQTHGGVAVKSQYLRTVKEWTRAEDVDAVIFSSQFTVPFSWLSRQAVVHVDGASGAYEVLVNGKKVGYTSNAFSPAEFDATKVTKQDMNTIQIRVLKNHWSRKLECFVADTEPRVGEVYVMSQPTLYIRDVVHNTRADVALQQVNVDLGFVVKTESLNAKKARIHYEIIVSDTVLVTYGHQDVVLDMKREDTVKVVTKIPYENLWSVDNPLRYRLNLKTQIEGRYVEYQTHMLGFRDLAYENGALYVNGIKTEPNFKDMDARTVTDKDIVAARAAKYNGVRFLNAAVPYELYRMCDSLGMYVSVAVPINTRNSGASRRVGGNESNNREWRESFVQRAENSFYTTRNYACVVEYTLANESSNGINLYESYLRLKELVTKHPVIYSDGGGEWNSDK
jgi:beta-galactosidase